MSRKRAVIRQGYEHARLSHDAAVVVDSLECARVHAGLVWRKLGSQQRDAVVDLKIGEVVANPGVEVAYPARVWSSLKLRGVLEDRHDRLWELTPMGVHVKLAGTRAMAPRPQSRRK